MLLLAGAVILWVRGMTRTDGKVMGELIRQFPMTQVKVQKVDLETDALKEEVLLERADVEALADFVSEREFKKVYSKQSCSQKTGYRVEGRDEKGTICVFLKVCDKGMVSGYLMDPKNGDFHLRDRQPGWTDFLEGLLKKQA